MARQERRTRPGGRSARVREAVHRAAHELLRERGGAELGIAEVAARAGVNPTSIYRRWGSREGLIMDLAVTQASRDVPIPDTGTLRGDLEAYAIQAARGLGSPAGAAFIRMLASALPATREGRAQRATYLAQRATEIEAILDRARVRGEPTITLDDFLEGILAPLYFRVLTDSRPANRAYAVALVDRLLDERVTIPARTTRGRRPGVRRRRPT